MAPFTWTDQDPLSPVNSSSSMSSLVKRVCSSPTREVTPDSSRHVGWWASRRDDFRVVLPFRVSPRPTVVPFPSVEVEGERSRRGSAVVRPRDRCPDRVREPQTSEVRSLGGPVRRERRLGPAGGARRLLASSVGPEHLCGVCGPVPHRTP